MWKKEYRDYPEDGPLKKETVEPSSGIVGCEMHDLNGWGERFLHRPVSDGLFTRFWKWVFGESA